MLQVNTHGSGNTYAFFMPNGTALIEILAWNFHGKGCELPCLQTMRANGPSIKLEETLAAGMLPCCPQIAVDARHF